ncbi:hypothetical protein M8A51_18355 [Schlegelella sp. S2-27]|uniref:Uncharacterized protein n=1 Tax=Caldimonas mangrovi TaxID=2944811 RepID=A0ABT0YS85_9BURK|nr:hypothetical protein [Caldimonas mangrovi]MCM5681493.1 hypothetical protein [Caldimonas mangrovi]
MNASPVGLAGEFLPLVSSFGNLARNWLMRSDPFERGALDNWCAGVCWVLCPAGRCASFVCPGGTLPPTGLLGPTGLDISGMLNSFPSSFAAHGEVGLRGLRYEGIGASVLGTRVRQDEAMRRQAKELQNAFAGCDGHRRALRHRLDQAPSTAISALRSCFEIFVRKRTGFPHIGMISPVRHGCAAHNGASSVTFDSRT